MNARPHRGLKNLMGKYEVEEEYIAHHGDYASNIITTLPAYWLT